jgi:ABC-type nitrate/sulfonate/bicarbonate transport system substrate-binding protein
VNDLGSYHNYLVRAYFIEHGMNPDKDVTIVPIPFGQMGPALVQKEVDAIMGSADDYEQVKRRIAAEAIDTATKLEKVDVSLAGAIGANTDFLRTRRDVAVRFLRAFLKARLWLGEAVAKNDPAAPELVAKVMKFSPERAQLFWTTRGSYYGKELDFVNLLDVQKRLIDQDTRVLKSIGLVKADVAMPYERAVDIGPLRDAATSLGLTWDDAKH